MSLPLQSLFEATEEIILGKPLQIRLAICCMLAKGHLLIEDVPGVGKTTLSHTLAKLFGLHYQRIQFTSDLLPADIIGTTVFNADNHEFTFHPGPLFNQMILADEINRATPKAQSALLEAMEERQATVEGTTHVLPEPFFVIATQNPAHQIGTFPLPESQLDRFLMRIELGYPDPQAERELLSGNPRHQLIEDMKTCITPAQLNLLQTQVSSVYVSAALLDYVLDIIHYTRQSGEFSNGLSPRAGLGLLNAAKAWAFIQQRDAVLPEDVQTVLPAVAAHRIQPGNVDAETIVAPLLQQVAIP